jgi:WD40 repeat protein/DNA-binding SARP family transcriptional activator
LSHLTLSLLGQFQVVRDHQPVTAFETDKGRALLAYLAVESDRAHSRSALAALLWPGYGEESARTTLRHVLHQLRQTLGDAAATPPFLLITRQTLQFNPQADHTIDVVQFTKLLAECAAHPHAQLLQCSACLERLRQAAELYRGDFLAGLTVQDSDGFEEWRRIKQEQLHIAALDVLHQLAEAEEASGDLVAAAAYARRQVALESWRESAHRQLMRILARSGQRTAALAQYQLCRQALREELGVEPDAATMTLIEQIRDGKLLPSMTPSTLSTNGAEQAQRRAEPIADPVDDLPETGHIYGRQHEVSTLTHWLVADRCRLVAILGMGGMGKTTLAAQVVKAVAGQFDLVIWRSLLNAPPLAELLRSVLQRVSKQGWAEVPTSLDEQLALLFAGLRERRCLLVLDNVESIFEIGLEGASGAGQLRAGYLDYGQLFQRAAQGKHNSCLVLTSREQPQGMARWEEDLPTVRSLRLSGLDAVAGEAMLQMRGLMAQPAALQALLARYSGNPLALKLVAETVQELFAGDVSTFLQEETPVFDDIRSVLDGQWVRLSVLEQELLLWLAIEREVVSAPVLHANLVQPPSWREFLEALRALRRRSLLEQTVLHAGQSAGFLLQNVVIEYLTDRLIEGISTELLAGDWTGGGPAQTTGTLPSHALTQWFLNRFALLKTQSKESVRQSQVRLILQPIANRLLSRLGRVGVSLRIQGLLAWMRQEMPLTPGYAAGNLLNLLLQLELQGTGFDFSHLCVWQADLRGKTLTDFNFAHAHLRDPNFTDTFGSTRCLAYSPDGQWLTAGLFTGNVRQWRASDGLPFGSYAGPRQPVESLAYSPDGQWLAGGCADQRIYLWSTQSGLLCSTLHGHNGRILTLAFHPNGRVLASGSEDMTIRFWAIDAHGDAACIGTLAAHDGWVRSLAFSPDGRWLVSGGFDCTLRLWAVDTDRPGVVTAVLRQVCTEHQDWVWSVAFRPDGTLVASGSRDRTIRLWSLVGDSPAEKRLALRSVLLGHTGAISALTFRPDGDLLASSSNDWTIRLWNPQTATQIGLLQGHTAMSVSLIFHPFNATLASGSDDHTIRLWDLASSTSGKPLTILQGYFQGSRSLAFRPDGSLLASGSLDQRVSLWNMEAQGEEFQRGQVIRTMAAYVPDGHALSFGGPLLAGGGSNCTVRLWRTDSSASFELNTPQPAEISAIALNPAGTAVAVGDQQGTIVVTNLANPLSGQPRMVLHGHTNLVTALAFSPDQTLLASCSHHGMICLWHVPTGELLARLEGHTNAVWSVAFSPDGETLATSSTDRTIRLWHVATGCTRQVLAGHTERIFAVAFTPDGQTLLSGSADQTLRVWEVATGRCLQILCGHTSWIWSVAVHPDGRRVATGSTDETIKVWDIAQGSCLATWRLPGPYQAMNITGLQGVTEAQRVALKALGAVEG